MFLIVKNHNTVMLRTKTLGAARDCLANIRKAALKAGKPATWHGRDVLHTSEGLGFTTYQILEG